MDAWCLESLAPRQGQNSRNVRVETRAAWQAMTPRHRFMSKPKTAVPPASIAATAPAPKAPAISKINLAGFATKSATTGKVYPVLPDPEGQVSELVASILTK